MQKLTKLTFRPNLKKVLPNLLIILGIVFLLISWGPLLKDELWFYIKQIKQQEYSIESGSSSESPFAQLLTTTPIKIQPVNTDFSIVIEKIGLNAPIVKDIPVWNEKIYTEALKKGIAHASISDYPSQEPGNTYLFAHASLNFFSLGKYSTVFNLLRKLEIKDRIHIFYEDKTYVYEVLNKERVKGWDTYPIMRPVIEPTLTLQTCDPPGTIINRLVITAKLIDVH